MEVLSRALTEMLAGLAVEPGRDEPTLKVILSALWNLSAHCKKNKADVCSILGSLVFLGGGILRNVSSYIATCSQGEEYRAILRSERCLALLLSQLRSPSLTIVSNACGTLWNFSARSAQDQEELWELGAVPMLQSLTNSKHNTISTCSLAALKNLYTARPAGLFMMVSGSGGAGQLTARKVKNMVADLDEKLSDCGPRDVEAGSPHSSPPASDQDDSGSEKEEDGEGKKMDERKREGSQGSRSPETGRKNLFLAGISEVAKQAGIAPGDLGAALPSCYQQQQQLQQQGQSMDERHNYVQQRRPGETRNLSEGRFDGQFVSYMKQPSREVSPQDEEQDGEEGECVGRVNLSPTSLLLSPSSTPLDLTTKHAVEVVALEAVEVEEQPTDYSLRYQESEEPELQKSDKPELNCDDALRTYCTEGTPMDTPFAFSTATSMSDLREPAIQEEEEEGQEEEIEEEAHGDEEDAGEEEKEVTVQYAVEGTPLAFSRAESLSDLEEVEVGEGEGAKLQAIPETGEEKGMAETEGEKREAEGLRLLHICPRRSSSVEPQRCEVLPRKLLSCSREPHRWPPWTASTTRGRCTTATRATRPPEQPLVVSHPPTCPTLQAKQCQHLPDREHLALLQGRAKPQVCPHWPPPTRSLCTRSRQNRQLGKDQNIYMWVINKISLKEGGVCGSLLLSHLFSEIPMPAPC